MNKKLNLGCGERILDGWINCDFQASNEKVFVHDLRNPLPFSTESFKLVYHSHVLEHLTPADARRLLVECQRILLPGGLLRIVVPDLEQRAKKYLQSLEEAKKQNNPDSLARHEWMILELVDQHVREKSGGEMVKFILSGRGKEFVVHRLGDEYHHVLRHEKTKKPHSLEGSGKSLRSFIREQLQNWAKRILRLSNSDMIAVQFERLGERHRWMYDRLSLGNLLKECGFEQVREVDAFSSQAPDWKEDGLWLDVEKGEVRKPDSLYMEARRPT